MATLLVVAGIAGLIAGLCYLFRNWAVTQAVFNRPEPDFDKPDEFPIGRYLSDMEKSEDWAL